MTSRIDRAERMACEFFGPGTPTKPVLVVKFRPKDIGEMAAMMGSSYADVARLLIIYSKEAKLE